MDALPLKKHGTVMRAVVAIPLVVGVDDDLIAAISRMPRKVRQESVKNALRGGIRHLAPTVVEPDTLTHLLKAQSDEIKWLREQITAMRPYFDSKFAAIGSVPVGFAPLPKQTQAGVDQAVLDKRRANLANEDY